MAVAFRFEDQAISRQQEVTGKTYGAYHDKPYAPVTVMPGNPDDFEVGIVDEDAIGSVRWLWVFSIGALSLVLGGAWIGLEVAIGREKRRAFELEVVEARIADVNLHHHGTPASFTEVTYTYVIDSKSFRAKGIKAGDVVAKHPIGARNLFVLAEGTPRSLRSLPHFEFVRFKERGN